MTAYVYLIRLDGAPKYVGFTTQTIEKRWKGHLKTARRAATHSHLRGPLQRALQKYEESAFTFEALYESEDVEHTKRMEHHYIWLHQTYAPNGKGGYNLTTGGDATTLSPETKEKIRQAILGKPCSPEKREKIRQGKLKNPMSLEGRETLRQLRLGKPRSEETKAKLRSYNLAKKRKFTQ